MERREKETLQLWALGTTLLLSSKLSPFGHAGRFLPLRDSILLVVVVDSARGAGVLHPHTLLLFLLLLAEKVV